MTFRQALTLAALAAGLAAGAAVAQDAKPAVNARKGQMANQAFYVGLLGGMAQGKIPYDAEAATAAAGNLAALAALDQRFTWPAGSEAGAFEGSRAKPEIWANAADWDAKWDSFAAVTATLAAAAGTGQEALGAAFGPVGGACGGCHEAYRVPNN